ncbi:hypothetical protein HDU98_001018 [Podochytrium sp. JEL0797]|nr:hypothetical protein HDU98_001018 [Podochytrium sp. JEL0797]
METSLPPPPPPTKKGRPRKDGACTKRAEQNRIAANNYRQRKDNRIKELELEVAKLRAENAALREAIAGGAIGTIVGELLPSPVVPGIPTMGLDPLMPLGTDLLDFAWPMDLCAADQFGPPQVLSTRFALKSIPSLANHGHLVDEMLDLFLQQAQCKDVQEIRKYLVKILRVRERCFAVCSDEDRERAIEVKHFESFGINSNTQPLLPLSLQIVELCKVNNRSHVTHLFETMGLDCNFVTDPAGSSPSSSITSPCTLSASPDPSTFPRHVSAFRDAARTYAPSVVTMATDVLDQLCDLFATQARCTDTLERSSNFFKGKELENKLLDNCLLDDRKRLASLLEKWHDQNTLHQELEAQVAALQAANTPPTSTTPFCSSCAATTEQLKHCLANIEALEQRIKVLQNECHQLKDQCPLVSREESEDKITLAHSTTLSAMIHTAVGIERRNLSPLNGEFGTSFGNQLPPLITGNYSTLGSGSSLQQQQQQMYSPFSASASNSTMHQQQPNFSNTGQSFVSPSFNDLNLNLLGTTASERLGSPPIVDFIKEALHALPSLRSCKWVDEMLDSFVSQSTCNEQETIRNFLFKILLAKHNLLDTCAPFPTETRRALEWIEMAWSRNRVHVDWMYKTAAVGSGDEMTVVGLEGESWHPIGVHLKRTLQNHVASLRGESADSILTRLVATFSSAIREPILERRAQLVVRVLTLMNQVVEQCCATEAERLEVRAVMDAARRETGESRRVVRELVEGVVTEHRCLIHDV